jgi:hypothetical protein
MVTDMISRGPGLRLLYIIMIIALLSCSRNDIVREYFESHGMSYPVDVSGVSLWGIELSGVERDELTVPGGRDFIEGGIVFIKDYFLKEKVKVLVPGTKAIVVNKPVFFRDESEEVGLMVRVIAYGEGKPGSAIKLQVEWIGEKKRFWKIENFAYFNRDGMYRWQFGGWVY